MYVPYDDFRPKYVLKVGDPVKGTLTVCTGHTDAGGGPPIIIGKKYTQAECRAYLDLDRRGAVAVVLRETPELYANKWTAGAAEDFAFNVGPRNYATSTLVKDFKAGRIEQGCRRLLDWKRSKGVVMQGLLNRRKDEMAKCLTGLNDGQ